MQDIDLGMKSFFGWRQLYVTNVWKEVVKNKTRFYLCIVHCLNLIERLNF